MNDNISRLIERYQRPGSFNHAPFTDEERRDAQSRLNVVLPDQFVAFLERYGHGGLDGFEILGMGINGKNIFLEKTLECRNSGLPRHLVVIENCDEWLECLNCETGEVVSWDMGGNIIPSFPSFDDFLIDRIDNAIDNM